MTIRAITKDELPAFWEILFPYIDELFPEGTPEYKEWREYFRGDEYRATIERLFDREADRLSIYYIEDDGAAVLGFAMCVTYKSEDGKLFIMEFCINELYRRRGLGAEFLKMIEDAESGAAYAELVSDEAAGFWQKQGFVETGVNEDGQRVFRKDYETKQVR